MAAKIVALVCVSFALVNVLQAQVLNRIPGLGLPGCGCGPSILPVADMIPNQVILPNYPSAIVDVPYGCGCETILPNQVAIPATTTIIQDSTVANNLANALQLLVVSNLLSNTLPSAGEIVVPSYGPIMDYGYAPMVSSCGYSPYNYIY